MCGGEEFAIIGQAETSHRWTVLSLLEWAAHYLEDRGFDEARLHAELMLARSLGVTRLDLYLQFDRPLAAEELGVFKGYFKRRLTHEPLQYILGDTEFLGLSLEVDRRVLIPRPETEILVEQASEVLRKELGGSRPSILDVGTGCGNIAVAIGCRFPAAIIVAVDVSDDALAVAGSNIAKHGLTNVQLQRLDILRDSIDMNRFDMVLSNPPYVPVADFATLQEEVREFEPRLATTDEGDGTTFHRRLFEVGKTALRPGGYLVVEIGFGQADQVRLLAEQNGFQEVSIVPDLEGIQRVVRARRPR
jgi:release factor glutamine methyltransferase